MALGTGIIISIVYGSCQLVLLFILCIKMYHLSRKSNDKISIPKFAYSVWKQRGIYSPVIIHIYDTATDVGVLYEWYHLAQIEKKRNLESLDMEQFFWIGIVFIIVYRVIAGFFGALLRAFDDDTSDSSSTTCSTAMHSLLGMVLGLLELGIFVSIHTDYKESKQSKKPYDRAGSAQKVSQLMEGVLESLPQVVMQSVFLMRAVNDTELDEAAGAIKELVIVSIVASLLSITNKYVWMDEFMVIHNAKGIFVTDNTKDDALKCGENKEHKLVEWKVDAVNNKCRCCGESVEAGETMLRCERECAGERMCFHCRDYLISHRDAFLIPLCRKSAYLSAGYIIRVSWRLSAVLSRFVIFALIWVVLGGAFEIILVPIMMVMWYIMVCCVASYGNSDMETAKETVFFCNCDDWKTGLASCCIIVAAPLLFIIMGFVFQMGILGITGRTLYFIRVIENIVLMSVISVFAWNEFDCDYCADAKQRSALNNVRILGWIVVGWTSVSIHCILSFIMPKCISTFYSGDIHTMAQNFYKTKQKRQTKGAIQTEIEMATNTMGSNAD